MATEQIVVKIAVGKIRRVLLGNEISRRGLLITQRRSNDLFDLSLMKKSLN